MNRKNVRSRRVAQQIGWGPGKWEGVCSKPGKWKGGVILTKKWKKGARGGGN
jgi:hypothetical protein